MSSTILDYQFDVIDHICRFADANDLAPVALLAMGIQESGLDPYAYGDRTIGGSYGIFQIYIKAHGQTPDYWEGIDGLDRSMAEMVGRWHEAFVTCGGWAAITSDLVRFVQTWVPQAQGSIAWNENLARQRVSQAVAVYSLYLKGQQTPAPAVDPNRELVDALTVYAAASRENAARESVRAADIDQLLVKVSQ